MGRGGGERGDMKAVTRGGGDGKDVDGAGEGGQASSHERRWGWERCRWGGVGGGERGDRQAVTRGGGGGKGEKEAGGKQTRGGGDVYGVNLAFVE